MKNRNIYIVPFLLGLLMFYTSCSKWTDTETVVIDKFTDLTPEEEAALIAYKKTDHPIMFAWMNYSPANPSMQTRLTGIPDSMDIVSYFTGYVNNEQNRKDVKFLQERRGTKVIMTEWADPYFEKNPNELDSLVRWAENMADSINAWGLDGFDLDYEPGYGGASWTKEVMGTFITTMGKYFGPKSGTGKLLTVDGVWRDPEYSEYLDYFISQAYNSSSAGSIDYRIRNAEANGIPAEKVILTEWISQAGNPYENGGIKYKLPDGTIVPSLWGMALYRTPSGKRVGGCGAYVLQFGYSTPNHVGAPVPPNNYYYIRQAIQLMNPAPLVR